MGTCDRDETRVGTFRLGTLAVESSLLTVVAGADTVKMVRYLALDGYYQHVSTGDDAALRLLSGAELPGVESLRYP
jgi:phosphoglycerate kinase